MNEAEENKIKQVETPGCGESVRRPEIPEFSEMRFPFRERAIFSIFLFNGVAWVVSTFVYSHYDKGWPFLIDLIGAICGQVSGTVLSLLSVAHGERNTRWTVVFAVLFISAAYYLAGKPSPP